MKLVLRRSFAALQAPRGAMLLLLVSLLSATISVSAAPAVMADPEVDRFNLAAGTQTFAPLYQFTTNTALVETSDAIRGMGSDIIKFYMGRDFPRQYDITLPGTVTNLSSLAQREPSCRRVLDMPFRHYFIWSYCFSAGGDTPWKDGFSAIERQREYSEMYAFARYLMTNYNGSGKSFYLGHWEGDWYLLPNYDATTNPTPTSIQGMIDWLNTRQAAIDDAKRDTPHSNVDVFVYAEANRVRDAMVNGTNSNQRVINTVVPYVTNLDYVSWSSYDGMNLSSNVLFATLDYMQSMLPTNKAGLLPGRRVFIGEYGWGGSYSSDAQEPRTRAYIQKLIQWGCPFILFWEVYNNEPGRAFWLIDDAGNKTPCYWLHQRFYNQARLLLGQFRQNYSRLPTPAEWTALVVPILNQPLAVPVSLQLSNGVVPNISSNRAQVTGTLTQGIYGEEWARVGLFWGVVDGGTNRAAWSNYLELGVNSRFGPTSWSVTLSNLLPATHYYFRYYATNNSGESWADPGGTFFTAAVNRPPNPLPFDLARSASVFHGFGVQIWRDTPELDLLFRELKVRFARLELGLFRYNQPLDVTGWTDASWLAHYATNDWASFDNVRDALARHGVSLVGTDFHKPTNWKNADGSLSTNYYTAFTKAVWAWLQIAAPRGIRPWWFELFNEPDGNWNCLVPASEYNRVVRAVRQQLLAKGLGRVQIVGPGRAHIDLGAGDAWIDSLDSSGLEAVRGWSIHGWEWNLLQRDLPQWVRSSYASGFGASVLARDPGRLKPVFITEFATYATNFHGVPGTIESNSYAARVFENTLSFLNSGAAVPIYWQAQDPVWDQGNYGLRRSDGSKRPVYLALQSLFNHLPPGARVLIPPSQPTNDVYTAAFQKNTRLIVAMVNGTALPRNAAVQFPTVRDFTLVNAVAFQNGGLTNGSIERVSGDSFSARLPPDSTLVVELAVLADSVPIIAERSLWRFLDTGLVPPPSWTLPGFDDSSWAEGAAELGFGDGDEAGLVDTNRLRITTWFRHRFLLQNPAALAGLNLRLKRDDGAVVFLNGVEVFRSNMPTGAITADTLASSAISGAEETNYFTTALDPGLLIAGTNVFAVEVHQGSSTSSDLSFDLALYGSPAGRPSARITQPADGDHLLAQDVLINAEVDGVADRVDYLADGVSIGQGLPGQPFIWSQAPAGSHVLTARAIGLGGAGPASPPIAVRVGLPRLSALDTNGTLRLQWPSWSADFVLRTTTNLGTPAPWANPDATVVETNGIFQTYLPMNAPRSFFQLQRP